MFVAIGPLLFLVVVGGIIAVVVQSARTASPDRPDAQSVDGADIAKSVVIHVGLFIAWVASTIGLIDLLQAFVEGDRIAGTNPDVARGLSLLIVGLPVVGALLWLIDRRHAERSTAGDSAAHRGWSVYLFAALATSLIATITSVVELTNTITNDYRDDAPEQLMQLTAWFAMWLVHWFVLRPRHGIRGDAHLALGSVIGLGWLATGIAAVTYRILNDAYNSAFADDLAGGYDLELFIVVGLVGASVWAWHWHLHFNNTGSVEGDRRRSPLWFVTVVVAGVLPGLIAMIVAITSMVSGMLIWIIGSTNSDAADFFEPSTVLVTVAVLGFASWAYHRWEIDRGPNIVRNESLRFHDYSVLFTTLATVVGATAVLLGQFFEALASKQPIAGSGGVLNTVIVAVTVLVASSATWWWHWTEVERHRALGPVEESDSIWRKLYLITAFGLGGLVLAGSTVWLVFAVLRDLLDDQANHETLRDLFGPVGWAIAVIGAVWYHLGVWRADRIALASGERTALPAPPPQERIERSLVTKLRTRPVAAADHGELFTLQRADLATRAAVSGSFAPGALDESLDSMVERLASAEVMVVVDGARIVGASVRPAAGMDGDAQTDLLVAPDHDRDVIARMLLPAAPG